MKVLFPLSDVDLLCLVFFHCFLACVCLSFLSCTNISSLEMNYLRQPSKVITYSLFAHFNCPDVTGESTLGRFNAFNAS